jgi:hypothetical protein
VGECARANARGRARVAGARTNRAHTACAPTPQMGKISSARAVLKPVRRSRRRRRRRRARSRCGIRAARPPMPMPATHGVARCNRLGRTRPRVTGRCPDGGRAGAVGLRQRACVACTRARRSAQMRPHAVRCYQKSTARSRAPSFVSPIPPSTTRRPAAYLYRPQLRTRPTYRQVSRTDAVFNVGRVTWLINALASGNIENLKYGVEDRLHRIAFRPPRSRSAAVYSHLYPMIAAAEKAGASAVYLSGVSRCAPDAAIRHCRCASDRASRGASDAVTRRHRARRPAAVARRRWRAATYRTRRPAAAAARRRAAFASTRR